MHYVIEHLTEASLNRSARENKLHVRKKLEIFGNCWKIIRNRMDNVRPKFPVGRNTTGEQFRQRGRSLGLDFEWLNSRIMFIINNL
jgi:hypothetical protein